MHMKRCFKTNFKFVTLYDTKNCAMFCSVKGNISTHQKSAVIYTIKRPRCGEENVGKTERCAITRLNELSNRSHQPMFQHLQHCTEVQKDDESIIKVWIRLPYSGNT